MEEFQGYLQSKGIRIVSSFQDDKRNTDLMNESLVYEHLAVISEFHKRAMGYDYHFKERIKNYTGRTIEKYKVDIKKMKRSYEVLKNIQELNNFQKLFMDTAEENIKRAEKCVNYISHRNYVNLILRSMRKCEICLENSYFDNLRKTDNVEVINVENCAWDLVEMDGIYFLRKLKKKGVELDWEKSIIKCCEYEVLGKDSVDFMLALYSYPYEYIKWCLRYEENKKFLQNDKYVKKLKKAIILDGKSLI